MKLAPLLARLFEQLAGLLASPAKELGHCKRERCPSVGQRTSPA